MTVLNDKYTNIFGDTEVAGRTPDAEGDYYLVGDAQEDHNYWQGKIVDVISLLSNAPSEEFQILYGCVVSDGGSGTINISEGVAKGKDSDGKKRLIPIPALSGVALPSGWNDDRQIWVIAKYDFKLTTDKRTHRAGTDYHYKLQDTYLGDINSENTTSTDDLFIDVDPTGTAPILGSFKMNGTTFTNMSLEERSPLVQPIRDDKIVGSSIKTESEYIAISPEHPWLCLSLSDRTLNPANYPIEFINKLRSRKYIYNEFSDPLLSPRAESFTGAWASNVFTLDDNAANVAMITELAEDWLYHGSPVTNWRILSDGTTEFNITGINVTSRTITVNLDSETATGTSVELYTNRVYRDATKARHFSEAGLATYQAGGGKSGRLFRRDQMQRITGEGGDFSWHNRAWWTTLNPISGAIFLGDIVGYNPVVTGNTTGYRAPFRFDSSKSPGARTSATTDGETRAKSSSRYEYIYVGSYTA